MPTLIADPDLLARSQVARALGVSGERVNQLWNQGELAFVQTPLGRLSTRAEVEKLAQMRAARRRPGSMQTA